MIARRLTGNSTLARGRAFVAPLLLILSRTADNVIRGSDQRVTRALLFPTNYRTPIGRCTNIIRCNPSAYLISSKQRNISTSVLSCASQDTDISNN